MEPGSNKKFTLKSGNTTSFKNMGSPAKAGKHTETIKHHKADKAHYHSVKRSNTEQGILTEQRENYPPEKEGESGSYKTTSRSGEPGKSIASGKKEEYSDLEDQKKIGDVTASAESPYKNVSTPPHPHNKKGEHVLKETRTKTSVTRTKGDRSSTYNVTNTEEQKDGSKIITLTNDLGESYKEVHSSRPSKKSPAKQTASTGVKKTRVKLKKAKKAHDSAKSTKGKVKASRDFYSSAF